METPEFVQDLIGKCNYFNIGVFEAVAEVQTNLPAGWRAWAKVFDLETIPENAVQVGQVTVRKFDVFSLYVYPIVVNDAIGYCPAIKQVYRLKPYTPTEIKALRDNKNEVKGIVQIDFEEVLQNDRQWVAEQLGTKLLGCVIGGFLQYQLVGAHSNKLYVSVRTQVDNDDLRKLGFYIED